MAGKIVVNKMVVDKFIFTRKSYKVTIVQNTNSDLSKWTITLNKADGTTLTNPGVGAYEQVDSIQITGAAYQAATEGSAFYYMVTGDGEDGNSYINGINSSTTETYSLNLTEDITISGCLYTPSSGCFSRNMMVKLASGEDVLISNIVKGTLVKSYNDVEQIVDSEVTFSSAKILRSADHYDKYTFSNGTVIEIVGRDRLYNIEDNKMKWMDQWNIGEHGLTYEGAEVALVSHEVINEDTLYYDFVCDYSNYFINGMLAGQKTAKYPFFDSRITSNNQWMSQGGDEKSEKPKLL